MVQFPCWLASSLQRVYPTARPITGAALQLTTPRGARVAFQACVRNSTTAPIQAEVTVSAPAGITSQVRRVGCVPVLHHNTNTELAELDGVGRIPGYVPDPLFPETSATVAPLETQAFWITLGIPQDAKVGLQDVSVRFTVRSQVYRRNVVTQADVLEQAESNASLNVRPLVLQEPRDFPVTHWFYADALCDWYHVEPFDEPFWRIVRPYMRDLVEHGGSCQYVPLFTPPTDGVKRPTQLLRVQETAPGRYAFDFSDVKRWTDLALSCGARYLEWTHLFWQWGIQYALRVYRSNQDRDSLLWTPDTGATSETYRKFLAQFLPAFHAFLADARLLERSFFHVSDEPHGEEHLRNYRAARALLGELAPWMKVMDALSEVQYGIEGITDMPIPVLSTAKQYREAGIAHWVYFCCSPRGRYLQRLLDTPLPKIGMAGWLFYRLGARGFLHWGYNYWYQSQTQTLLDPFTEQAGAAWPGWAYGDPFQVYPGDAGPLDSIRWEVWAESLQDYALLQSAGVLPESPVLAEIVGYDEFPKSEEWIRETRNSILA